MWVMNDELLSIMSLFAHSFKLFKSFLFAIEYPFEQLPVLEVDGKFLTQSRAIAGYLANEFGINCTSNKTYY